MVTVQEMSDRQFLIQHSLDHLVEVFMLIAEGLQMKRRREEEKQAKLRKQRRKEREQGAALPKSPPAKKRLSMAVMKFVGDGEDGEDAEKDKALPDLEVKAKELLTKAVEGATAGLERTLKDLIHEHFKLLR